MTIHAAAVGTLAVSLLVAAHALAQVDAPPVPSAAPPAAEPPADALPGLKENVPAAPPRTWASIRGGLSNDPTILQACGEVTPLDTTLQVGGRAWHTGLSIEGCGNGSGLLFRSPAPEIAHFRGKWKLWAFDTSVGWFEPIVAVGFAELQTGGDAPGFSFDGVGPGGNSTAGPEAGTSLRYKVPLGFGFELLAEAGLSVAYFAYARDLNVPADPIQTSLVLTAGLGW